MNDQFIQNVWIDWSKVEEGSYLRNIETIRKMERIDFHRSITFLWEKTEVENPPYWKPSPSPSPAALIPKEERKTTAFPPGIRILSFAMPSEYPTFRKSPPIRTG